MESPGSAKEREMIFKEWEAFKIGLELMVVQVRGPIQNPVEMDREGYNQYLYMMISYQRNIGKEFSQLMSKTLNFINQEMDKNAVGE